jgi:hypothetical protein
MVGSDKQPDLGWIVEVVLSLSIQKDEKAPLSVLLSDGDEDAEV